MPRIQVVGRARALASLNGRASPNGIQGRPNRRSRDFTRPDNLFNSNTFRESATLAAVFRLLVRAEQYGHNTAPRTAVGLLNGKLEFGT